MICEKCYSSLARMPANNHAKLLLLVVLLLMLGQPSHAQSLDPSKPTPVRSSTLNGHIAARDLGDARVTDHYYKFTGTPGDLLITVRSQNLNGDLDVFTAVGLRPLLKVTLYAESTNPITKGIYLRKREDLILRIEARSPNDDEGTYDLFFGGSFAAISGPDIGEDEASTTETPVASANRKGKRVSSAGARLPEPEPTPVEVAAAPTPEPTPEVKPEETVTKPKAAKPAPAPRTTASRTTPRTRRSTTRRTTSPTTTTKPKETETATTEETKKEETVAESPEPAKTRPAPRTKRGTTASRSTKPEAAPSKATEPEAGPRLVIETNDGTLINRSMSTVRRVLVENGWVVIAGKDGKIDRILLVNVVRMSIAP
jgi:hypothetical protein